jgi:MerR family transcriptional regulator, copper efflux regulator
LPPAHRTPPSYRVYSADVVGVLAFVERARRLGLTLGEILQIVALRRAGSAPCVHVRRLLEQKSADLASPLGALRSILRAWPADNGRHAPYVPTSQQLGSRRDRRTAPRIPPA